MYQTLTDCIVWCTTAVKVQYFKPQYTEYTQGRPNIILGVVYRVICHFNDIICSLVKTFLKCMKSMLMLIFVSLKL